MNKFIASGNLGKDCSIGQSGDKKVINFSIGCSSGYGDKKQTFWLECSKWGENTKVADYLQKGQKVLVSGELSVRTYEKDGKTGTSLCLRCDEIELIGGKQEATTAAPTQAPQAATVVDDESSSLPF